MQSLRKVIFWAHLVCGAVAGLIILVMSATGVLLTYEKQMMLWADTRNYQIAVPVGTERLSVEDLLAKVQAAQNAAPTGIMVRADQQMPVAVSFDRGRTVYVNPHTGEAMGEGALGTRNFFRAVTDWHRWLGTEGAGRATGRMITGVCNLAFLFIVVSGLYLWFPRSLTWAQFKNILWFRRGLPGKARDFNWHNVIGFWSLVPLFLIVLSGVTISFAWAGNLVYRVVGENPPTPAARPATPAQESQTAKKTILTTTRLNSLWARAEQHSPGWKSLSVRFPASTEAPLAFTIDHGTGGEPHKRATLTLDRATGETLKWETFSGFTKGRQLRSFLRFAHTGEVAGIAGQTIAGIVSLGGVVLVWTGLAMAWRRFLAWKARRAKVVAETEALA
ncbi:MAG: PepSY-associated TM helix domain-containing protein [Acidobacteriota bacterium]|nr:PepSY-associated TM helix domain-containing protein [Acidobacteriota bacterium]